jgi:hypothetical protein
MEFGFGGVSKSEYQYQWSTKLTKKKAAGQRKARQLV